MIRSEILVLILGMGLVTYIPRWAPLFFLSRRDLPAWFIEWLDLIPVAILSALVVPELLTSGDPRHVDLFQPRLLVALPTFFFALKTKSLAGTVILGMVLFWLSGRLFG
jgi:branched-subunit amino acid transport protein